MKLDPRPENYAALGAVYRAAGRSPEAEDTYRKGIAAHPKSYQAHMALGQFYFSEKKLAEAEAEMRVACDLDSHAMPPRLFLGRLYVLSGKLSAAESLYAGLKPLAPDDPQAYQALGVFSYRLARNKRRLQSFALSWPPRRKTIRSECTWWKPCLI